MSYLEKWGKFDESLGHGYLIFAIVIFELFKSSSHFIKQHEKPKHYLFIIIVLLAIFHEISSFWGILIFQQLSFYFIWLVAIAYILGTNYLKRIYFPLAFLLFAVPFWEFSNTFFLDLTTQAVTLLLSFSDLTIFIHENFIETPYGMIVVAEGCSGIRYFEIGFALSVYAVHGEKLPIRYKLLVIFIGIALGIITNWIRVIGLVYIGYWSEMTSSLMKEHETYGFILFFFVISAVIFLVNYLRSKHSLTINQEKASTESIAFPMVNSVFKTLVIVFTILLLNTILFTNFPTPHQPNEVLQAEVKTFELLNNFGKFNETQSNISYQDKNCKLIVRTYDFVTPGDNVLPYTDILNKEISIATSTYSDIIHFQNNVIEVNQIDLRSLNSNSRSNLYYWYEYSGYKTNNKYIAKLFEITYLLNSNDKMTLNAIWCPTKH
jgi:exosortase